MSIQRAPDSHRIYFDGISFSEVKTVPCNEGEWNNYAVELTPMEDGVTMSYKVQVDGFTELSGTYGAVTTGEHKVFVSGDEYPEASGYLLRNFVYEKTEATT